MKDKIRHDFFKLKEDFHIYKKGDKVLFSTYFNDMVLLATPTKKTAYYTLCRSLSEYGWDHWYTRAVRKNLRDRCEHLTKKEIIDLFPHLTNRIKETDGYFALAQYLPERMCTGCIVGNNLEVRPQWIDTYVIDKYCYECKQTVKGRLYPKNALKSINL